MDSNNTLQHSIYQNMYTVEPIDFDDWLLSPNAFATECHFRQLKPRHNDKILEIGLGRNAFLGRSGSKYSLRCFGVDLSMNALRAQKINRPNALSLAQGLGEQMPFRDKSFDYVVAIGVLEHVSDFPGTMREINRVLRPGGKCMVWMPCRDFKYSWFSKLRTYEMIKHHTWFTEVKQSIGHDFHRIPTRTGWASFLRDAGLEIRKITGTDILIDSLFMYYWYPVIGRTYYGTVKALNRLLRRKKSAPAPSEDTCFEVPAASTGGCGCKRISPLRKVLGFFWYFGVLTLFMMALVPEKIFSRWPVGAGAFFDARKPT